MNIRGDLRDLTPQQEMIYHFSLFYTSPPHTCNCLPPQPTKCYISLGPPPPQSLPHAIIHGCQETDNKDKVNYSHYCISFICFFVVNQCLETPIYVNITQCRVGDMWMWSDRRKIAFAADGVHKTIIRVMCLGHIDSYKHSVTWWISPPNLLLILPIIG